MREEQIKNLLEQMTLEEKLGQLTQTTGEHFIGKVDEEMVETGPGMDRLALTEENVYTVGSVLGVSSAEITNAIQKNYLEKNRLHIPLLFMHDAIHGYRTIFPIPLALSCSFDKELVRKTGEYTASELRASGIHVDFSPMTDLVRDARWGRVMESFGEDPLLSGELGKAMIQGYQKEKNGVIAKDGVAACLKHFAAYGAADAGKDYASVDMSLKEFFGCYAKPYEIALEGMPKLVMSSFNSFNGEPVTASKFMLDDVLRNKMGFDGLIISDWGAVSELKNHGIAANDKDAGRAAMQAGVEIEMVSTSYMQYAKDFIAENKELLSKIDQAVYKVLALKNELGLFENPYVDENEEAASILTKKTLEFAKESAKETCVLLKNEGVLPLDKKEKQILILGPFAKTKELLGNWRCKGKFEECISLEEGIKQVFTEAKVLAYETLEECPNEILDQSEIILLAIGESWELSGEGHSSVNLELPVQQQELIENIAAQNKKFACIIFSGRPLALGSVIDKIPSILWCWYPGSQGGIAIAELTAGDGTPTGKLTMSFPRVTGQTPLYYNENRSGRPASDSSYSSRYQDCEIGALFPFGYGLSYADIQYTNYQISNTSISDNQTISLSMEIENKSKYSCKETVILYMEDPISNKVRPVREMIAFQKVSLDSGEMKTVVFEIAARDLNYTDTDLRKVIEPGAINLYVNSMEKKVYEIQYC